MHLMFSNDTIKCTVLMQRKFTRSLTNAGEEEPSYSLNIKLLNIYTLIATHKGGRNC